MKLYEIPRGSKLLLSIQDDKGEDLGKQMCVFDHLDGLYSVIRTPDNHIVHLSRFAELVKVEDHYDLEMEE